ncbi:MAG: hypothetical protein J6Q15_01500 [Clostridia bacterium]|nr:hypothetical protein [Clostridia bacterium]
MIKKKSNTQNIIIIILCILLLISITFGVTYSYYNGRTNLVKGSITTANLAIELHNDTGKTTEFSISAPFGEEFLVPGNNLNNVELNLYNKSARNTYIVVLYSLSATKADTGEDVTPLLNNTPAISFQDNAIDNSTWKHITYRCALTDASYTCLVGINPFEGRGSTAGTKINVLKPNSIKIPGREWGDVLQNCNVTISVVAYALQSDGLDPNYEDPILDAAEIGDTTAKAHAIAKAVLQVCGVDVA